MTVDELLKAIEFKDRYPEHCSGKDMESILLMARFIDEVRAQHGDNLKNHLHRMGRLASGPAARIGTYKGEGLM